MEKNTSQRRKEMLWCLLFVLPYSALGIDSVIDTSSGKVRGTTVLHSGNDVQVFLGIPFAQPPTGDLRFRKTVPVVPWDGIYEATEFGSACIQPHFIPFPGVDSLPNQSEDCLNLNIWVPANTTKDSKKAVMFWIYGGSFYTGSNRLRLYDGGIIALEDVLVVNINYRLSVMGFLSSPIDKARGNMGLYDILEALKWVNQNINAFGGDRNRITVFGESAGSISAGLLCVSPLAQGLFQRVIMESGSPAYDVNDQTLHNLELGQKLAESVGCASVSHNFETFPDDVIKCLKTKDAKELVIMTSFLNNTGFGFYTIVGDDFLPCNPKQQLIDGIFHNADVLIGHNQDEGSIFFAGFFHLFFENDPKFNRTTAETYIRKMFKGYPAQDDVVHHYLDDVAEYDFETIREQTYHSLGDYGFVCPDMYFGESYAKKGNDVYAYYFNVIPSVPPYPFPKWMGSVHSAEIPFVFGLPLDLEIFSSAADRLLSQRIVKIWTDFAKYGYPGENWEKFSRQNQYFKEFMTDDRKSYLEDHKKNCNWFRQFFGFE